VDDPVGRLALKVMGDSSDESIDALPSLWKLDFNPSLGRSPSFAVEVDSDLLREGMARITKLPGWGHVNSVWVYAVNTVASVNIEIAERRRDSGVKCINFLGSWLRDGLAGSWHPHCE
jgi:hypothetical protein